MKHAFKKLSAAVCVAATALFATACVFEKESTSGENEPPSDVHVCEYKAEIIPPSCTESGYTVFKCDCGKQYVDRELNAAAPLGCDYSEWHFNDDATCTQYGTKTQECSRCHSKTTTTADDYPKKPHSFTDYISNDDATCVKNGTETAKCDNCTTEDTRDIPNSMVAHKYTGDYCDVCHGIKPDADLTEGLEYSPIYKDGMSFGEVVAYKVKSRGTVDAEVVKVPKYYDGKPVTAVGYNAFASATRITKIELPDSIKHIDNYAFKNCVYLSEVVMQDGVEELGMQIFEGCVRLKKAVIPDSVVKIDQYIFKGCSALESITLPFLGETPTDATNANMRHLFPMSGQNISVPSTLQKVTLTKITAVYASAFSLCQYLKCVALPATVESIAASSFSFCASLDTIEFGGTRAQWDLVDKTSGWDSQLAIGYQVVCADDR